MDFDMSRVFRRQKIQRSISRVISWAVGMGLQVDMTAAHL